MGEGKWPSLKGCKKADGVFTCPIGDNSPCMPGWALNADATWDPPSEYSCPATEAARLFEDSEVIASSQTSPPIFVASMALMVALLVASAVGLRRGKAPMEEQEELLTANE